MPIPKPKKNENHDDFIERCMSNETMKKEYPDNDQRYAICQSSWDDKKSDNSEKQISLFTPEKEVRSFILEIQNENKEDRKLTGHAAVFGEMADIGGWFNEVIEPGAFKSSIKKDDIRALFNHNPDYVLGRNKAGTLKLSEDEKGLSVSIDPPDTQFARDLSISINRGDINQMSFGFQVIEEEWIRGEKKDPDLRKIKKVRLFDVSPVTFPAYEGTDIAVRSHEAWKKQQEPELPPTVVPELPDTLYYRQQLTRRF